MKDDRNGDDVQFGLWLRVTPSGHRNGGAGRGRSHGGWRNTVQPSNSSATSKEREGHRANEGSNVEANDGASTRKTETQSRAMKEKFSKRGNSHQPFNASEISENPLNQEREEASLEDCGEEL
ncbi:hypothetical protein FH972_010424 [Carpinus fangiana]|uniref:Uncharacterized protein n=1 Tax=Carpinus fangiana TaxID=176857 RepID=A0A660KUB8_9ROSI|nr:hypothetical protein FH972_010424 [Carpinus fangiana]